MPKVSVVMAVFNEEQNISRAMDSILSQTYKDFEFIIINDGSTDNTLKIIREYRDNRIKLIDKGYNSGLADSLNIGIQNAQGDFIARMDADDFSEKDRLEIQVEFLENNPDLVLVGTWAYLNDLNSNTKKKCEPPTSDKSIKKYMQKDNPFIHSSVMLRKDILKRVGYYNPMVGMEDYDLWIRIGKYYKVANIPIFLVTRYENRNIHTRPFYKGLKRYDIYSLRLQHQLQAIKNFRIYPETIWYLSRTIICMILYKLGLRK
ncbi:MAG: glycosyltransferase [bacterium]|nr:glycosyltransferase [bacterium]